MTIVNGCKSQSMPVRFGIPQGSVLGPTLVSLFCNDLPDVVDDGVGKIHMYADDTTLYVAARTPDEVAITLNKILVKLYDWCCRNGLFPHPGKTGFMLLGCGKFVGPLQDIKLGDNSIKHVRVSRCLGIEVDQKLN